MIRQALLLVLLLVVPLAALAEEKKNPLEGKWKLKSVASNDTDTMLEAGLILHFDTTHAWINDAKEKDRFKYKIDVNAKPTLLDVTTPDGKDIEGIWEVKGDTLRLCICSPQGVKFRPTEFHGRENQILLVLERVKE